jgi:hypothetical protein
VEQLNTLPITDAEALALSIHKGGTAASTAEEAAENLNLITYNNQNVVKLDVQGKLIPDQFANINFGSTVSIKGPNQLFVGTVTEFEITDYDNLRFYEIFSSNCIVERTKDKIYVKTYSVPMKCSFEINKRLYQFDVVYSPVNRPVIAYPSNGMIELDSVLIFESNIFSMSNSYDQHASSDWQLALDVNFSNIVKQSDYDKVNRTTWSVTELIENTTYYLRVRHRSVFSGSSEWSNVCIFKTREHYKPAPPVLENPEPNSNSVNLKATFTFSDFEILGKANDRHFKTDWQLAVDPNFDTVIKSSFNDVENLNSWYVEGLSDFRVYYIRARYTGVNYGQGDWSPAYSFTTIVSNTVSTPSISSPVRNSTGNPLELTVKSSAFNISDGYDTHLSSDWQLAIDPNFIGIVQQSLNDTVNKSTWTLNTLLPNRNYYLRVRYKGQILGSSYWSNTVTFKTIGVDRPYMVSPENNAQDQKLHITLRSSDFSATGTEDDHASSDWQIAVDSSFNSIVQSYIDDTVNLTTLPVTLNLNTVYYVRVRHNGAVYGKGDWSNGIKFSTITKFIVIPPRIISPESGINNQSSTVKITANAFSVNDGTDTHTVSYWQLSKNLEFTDIVQTTIDDPNNKTTWVVTNLQANTTYYARVKYKGLNNGYSDWSLVSNFKTVVSYNPVKPTVDYPLNKANNVNLSDLAESSEFQMTGGSDYHEASDWQIATDINFTTIVKSEVASQRYLQLYTFSGLNDLTRYYIRVRHKGQDTGYGPWSDPIEFTTIIKNTVNTPAITSPANNSSGNQTSLTLLSSAFAVSGGNDTHKNSQWQVATDAGFLNIVSQTTQDTINKTKYSPEGLVSSKTYYARVRYQGNVLPVSAWSPTIAFSTLGLAKPSITNPVNGAGDIFPSVIFKSSAFASNIGTDTHKSSDWQLSTDVDFLTIVASTNNDTVNKTTWAAALSINTTYYIRVRHTGNSYGTSAWSDPVSFTTIKNFTVNKPAITSPVNNSQNLRDTFDVTATAFATSGGSDYQVSADWQVATDSGFVNVIKSSINDAGNLTTWTVSGLSVATVYYLRVKYEGANYGASDWSSTIMFSTKANFEPTTEEAAFYAGDRGYQNHFGEKVCISGDGQRIAATDLGNKNVYVFRKSGTSWVQEYKVTAEYYGASISLDYEGKTLLIGSPWDTIDQFAQAGAAYVYVRSNTSWSYSSKMNLSVAVLTGYEKFGNSVSLTSDGAFCIIGCPGFSNNGVKCGGAFIFRRDGFNWSQASKLIPTDGIHGDGFGTAVSISNNGTKAVVGAPDATRFSSVNCGSVYVFKNMLEFWDQEAILYSSDRLNYSKFGAVLAISGDGQRFIAGGNTSNSYIFKLGTTWSQEHRITKAGRTVAMDLSGSRAVVGDPNYSIEGVYSQLGCIYTFSRNGGTWSDGTRVTPSLKRSGLSFGNSVGISSSGAVAVVGAYDTAVGGIGMVGSGGPVSTSGQVFIFS